ncbi:MAG: protein-L-isoaspartate O-methyltransferase [Promethearchaeota archaeon]|jgi:protein-L-isoaspartate(D-aspartate) O-methyltransferase
MKNKYIDLRHQLVNRLIKEERIKSKIVENAFLSVPREEFIPIQQKKFAYMDKPLDIGFQQTISAPHMIAIMVEALDIQKGQKILEIGTGSGYHASIVATIIGNDGVVFSIERINSLAKIAKTNLMKIQIKNVKVINGDGSLGLKENAPFDRIYVTCAAPIVPQPLIDQLKNMGSLLIPVGDMICDLLRITKKDDKIITEHLGGCAFVPLIGKYGFPQ